MNMTDILFFVLYGSAFLLVLYFILGQVSPKTQPNTVVVYDQTPVSAESVWYPWIGGGYNYWPYWSGWYNGGSGGGYGYYGGRWGGRPFGGGGFGAHAGGFGGHAGGHGAHAGGHGGGHGGH